VNIGRAIKILRASMNVRQNALAARTGTTSSYLSLVEAGKKTPSLDFVAKVAEALDVSVPELFVVAADPEDLVPKEIRGAILDAITLRAAGSQ
jgi:transcriptional regulator with XRE-family HTH domain